jgi:hypothetical protein
VYVNINHEASVNEAKKAKDYTKINMMGAQPGENLDYGEEEALVSMV